MLGKFFWGFSQNGMTENLILLSRRVKFTARGRKIFAKKRQLFASLRSAKSKFKVFGGGARGKAVEIAPSMVENLQLVSIQPTEPTIAPSYRKNSEILTIFFKESGNYRTFAEFLCFFSWARRA